MNKRNYYLFQVFPKCPITFDDVGKRLLLGGVGQNCNFERATLRRGGSRGPVETPATGEASVSVTAPGRSGVHASTRTKHPKMGITGGGNNPSVGNGALTDAISNDVPPEEFGAGSNTLRTT